MNYLNKHFRAILVLSILVCVVSGCSKNWMTYRHNALRNAHQPNASALSDPLQVGNLVVKWSFPDTAWSGETIQGFRSSPVVYNNVAYIGNGNGRLYALNASTGAFMWRYPATTSPALLSNFTCNPSSWGIAASPTIAKVGSTYAVIFAAPDKSIGAGIGDTRLFALDATTGVELWKSPAVARITGTSSGSTTELHEQTGYSPPLVYGDRVYTRDL